MRSRIPFPTHIAHAIDGSKLLVVIHRIAFISFLLPCSLAAQEVIPNGDFEQYAPCPTDVNQMYLATPWYNAAVDAVVGPTPDYFNACASSGAVIDVPDNAFGTQAAHSGSGYAGIGTYFEAFPNLREYMEVPLSQPLVEGQCYEFSLYMSLSDNSSIATGDMGVHFSDTAIVQSSNLLPLVPQLDHLGGLVSASGGWTSVTGLYEAHGGESYLVIGSFHDVQSMTSQELFSSPYPVSYYYIDDVSLVPVTTDCGTPVVEQGGSTSSSLFPNPVVDRLWVHTAMLGEAVLIIRDASGRVVLNQEFTNDLLLEMGEQPAGLYTWELRSSPASVTRGKIIKQ